MTSTLHLSSTALIRRLCYRHGFPFITSAVLALVTSGWSYVFGGTSIWTIALLALISTAFALLFGGPFRTFYITIAVMPPFLFIFGWLLRRRFAMPDFLYSKVVDEYFLYFVAAPILLVWIVASLLNRKERHA
jgi:hypothetical protein